MNVADKLRAAADMIEERGLAKRTFRDQVTGKVCTTYAIVHASPDSNVDVLVYLKQYLKITSVTGWNDKPERTEEEVIRTLRQAADKWTNFVKS